MKQQKGFTLVELLVAVGIIGVLAGITVVSVGNVRQRARDSKRVADVKQIQASLEQTLNDVGAYPTLAAQANIGSSKICRSDTATAIEDPCNAARPTIVLDVPPDVRPPTGDAYRYSYISATGATYRLRFALETGTGPFATSGCYEAVPSGMQRYADIPAANAACPD